MPYFLVFGSRLFLYFLTFLVVSVAAAAPLVAVVVALASFAELGSLRPPMWMKRNEYEEV